MLPPGQREITTLPRFGVDTAHPPPQNPAGGVIEVVGDLSRRVAPAPSDLAALPRTSLVSGLHCVAGWSVTGLEWEGVRFADFYARCVEPALRDQARVRYLVFVGLDGYRSIVLLEDALRDDVLLADRLHGAPLSAEHGAPVRLISPDQYGYISTKHLCRIELLRSEPVGFYHPNRRIQLALQLVRPHRRARVRFEERHRYLPSWLARRIYRAVVALPGTPAPPAPVDVATPRA